jgi:hypothetical protein
MHFKQWILQYSIISRFLGKKVILIDVDLHVVDAVYSILKTFKGTCVTLYTPRSHY